MQTLQGRFYVYSLGVGQERHIYPITFLRFWVVAHRGRQ